MQDFGDNLFYHEREWRAHGDGIGPEGYSSSFGPQSYSEKHGNTEAST